MTESFFLENNILFNPARLLAVLIFLCGFHLSLYGWLAFASGRKSLSFFVTYMSINKSQVLKDFFNDGPGYLVLPFWLVVAAMSEKIIGPMMY